MLTFILPEKRQEIQFSDNVLDHFLKKRQVLPHQKEVGGQLFATITPKTVSILASTGPDKLDTRRRFSLFLNKRRIQREIDRYFKKGLHYVGDWHTHPQHPPFPSKIDFSSMEECFLKSDHELNYFLMVVVGQSDKPSGIWVGLINGHKILRLQPVS